MISSYRDGYWKALLDIYNALSNNNDTNVTNKSKKKYKNFVLAMINVLLKEPEFLDEWMAYGGMIEHSDIYKCYVDDDGTFFIEKDGRSIRKDLG